MTKHPAPKKEHVPDEPEDEAVPPPASKPDEPTDAPPANPLDDPAHPLHHLRNA